MHLIQRIDYSETYSFALHVNGRHYTVTGDRLAGANTIKGAAIKELGIELGDIDDVDVENRGRQAIIERLKS